MALPPSPFIFQFPAISLRAMIRPIPPCRI
jgi:hypothetical protein